LKQEEEKKKEKEKERERKRKKEKEVLLVWMETAGGRKTLFKRKLLQQPSSFAVLLTY